DRMVEGGFEEFGLVREVIVDARRRDSGGGGEVGDAHGIEAVPAEQRPSGLNDVALRGGLLGRVACARRGVRGRRGHLRLVTEQPADGDTGGGREAEQLIGGESAASG